MRQLGARMEGRTREGEEEEEEEEDGVEEGGGGGGGEGVEEAVGGGEGVEGVGAVEVVVACTEKISVHSHLQLSIPLLLLFSHFSPSPCPSLSSYSSLHLSSCHWGLRGNKLSKTQSTNTTALEHSRSIKRFASLCGHTCDKDE